MSRQYDCAHCAQQFTSVTDHMTHVVQQHDTGFIARQSVADCAATVTAHAAPQKYQQQHHTATAVRSTHSTDEIGGGAPTPHAAGDHLTCVCRRGSDTQADTHSI